MEGQITELLVPLPTRSSWSSRRTASAALLVPHCWCRVALLVLRCRVLSLCVFCAKKFMCFLVLKHMCVV